MTDRKYPITGSVWFRESTQEWVLELEGSINGTYFIYRYPEPSTTLPEDVPGLPSLYHAADRIEALLNLNEALVELMDDRDAKLAKATEALREIYGNGDATGRNPQLMANIARTTLAEIESSEAVTLGEKG
jgi:hypothetical protein